MNASCFNKTDKDFPFRQMNGYYFCKEITLDVGDGILEEAFVHMNGSFEKWVLVYSYFNGGKTFYYLVQLMSLLVSSKLTNI